MNKALSFPAVFKALLSGGYIVLTECFSKRRTYWVFNRDKSDGHGVLVGHITESQMVSLLPFLLFIRSSKNKSGDILSFYCLDVKLIDYDELLKLTASSSFN